MAVTLLVTRGAEAAPISEGTTAFVPYRADHTDPDSPWLVDVPPETAARLCHNNGFARYPMDETAVPAGMARIRHPELQGCSWGGTAYGPDEDGSVLVPAGAVDELRAHGFAPVDEAAPVASRAAADPALAERHAELAAEHAELRAQLERVTAERDAALAELDKRAKKG